MSLIHKVLSLWLLNAKEDLLGKFTNLVFDTLGRVENRAVVIGHSLCKFIKRAFDMGINDDGIILHHPSFTELDALTVNAMPDQQHIEGAMIFMRTAFELFSGQEQKVCSQYL